jgi:elongation factor 1-beta
MKVVMKLRIMPNDVEVDLEALKKKIAEISGIEVRDFGIQPIAFGLKALIAMVIIPANAGDSFIEKIQQIEGVESVEVESLELL